MSSFINLMANDVWSDDDIKARLHAEFRTEISEFAEREIYRALHALHLRMRPLSLAEQAVVGKFAAVDGRVSVMGVAARADMALLNSVFAYEAAMARLAQPEVEESATDLAEREAALAVTTDASSQVVDLYLLRKPPAEEPIVEEPPLDDTTVPAEEGTTEGDLDEASIL
jgi:hypothetical protein